MMKRILLFLLLLGFSCSQEKRKKTHPKMHQHVFSVQENVISCTDSSCIGTYKGLEFDTELEQSDIAHQYSNSISKAVGDHLKKLFREGHYSKVDFEGIKMTTKGMNDGDNYVEYSVKIPFKRVKNKCEAMTAFDHSGGWNHYPAIAERKRVLLNPDRTSVVNGQIEISDLKKTHEGLQEFWIQWKHKDYQSDCSKLH